MPNPDKPPKFTVIYPEFDVRGHAAEHLRAWTAQQILPRDRYRIVAVLTPGSEEEAAIQAELGPGDKLLHESAETDTAMWNAGAAVAETPWLVFTEGHTPPHPDCLAALERWLDDDPDASAGNFAIEHPDDYLMGRISDRWFGEQIARWGDDWPRLHRAGYAIRRDVFEDLGGYEDFGQFAPPLLSARFHAAGHRMELVPRAAVVHIDDRDLHGHHFDTIDFVLGECAARESEDSIFFEDYFGHNPIWRNRMIADSRFARDLLLTAMRAFVANGKTSLLPPGIISELMRGSLGNAESRVGFEKAITLAEESTLLHAPVSKERRYRWFVRAHRRVVDTTAREWIVDAPPKAGAGISHGVHQVDTLGPYALGGVHALESYGERRFRWSDSLVHLRFSGNEAVTEVRIDTGNLRNIRRGEILLAACGDRPLPSRCIRKEKNGTLVLSIPEKLGSRASRSGLSLVIDPLPSAEVDPAEQRRLGLPIFEIEVS